MFRIASTCLAFFVLGVIAHADDRGVAEAWKAAGNHVKLDKEGHLVELTFTKSEALADADYEKLSKLSYLKRLTFYGKCTTTDAQAAQVGKLAALEHLAANGTAFSDAGFEQVAKLKELRQLTIWHLGWQNKELTGKGFAALAGCPKLERFNFSGSTVGDEGLMALEAVKTLKEVSCNHSRVTDGGLAYLKELPHLTSVHVGPQFSMRLGDAGLTVLASILTLEEVHYNETILTYDGSLKHLKALKGLKKLTLDKVEIAPADLAKLKADMPAATIEHAPPPADRLEAMRKIVDKKK